MNSHNWSSITAGRKSDDSSGRNDHNSDRNRVETANNRLYFYAGVNRSTVLTLNKSLKNMEINTLNRATTLQADHVHKVYVHINSFGGSVFAGLSAMDYIKRSKIPVTTVIDGCAASAATMMSIVAPHRQIHEHSFMLIHQLSAGSWGKYEELKDDMKNNEMLMKVIKSIYEQHTKVPKAQLANILKHDLWWDAKTCLKYGLVDEII